MAPRKFDRRSFLNTSAQAGIFVCGLCMGARMPGVAGAENTTAKAKKLDPEKLNYCGYSCPADCQFLKATLEDDLELKKAAWALWKIEERFGLEFDPEQAFCYGCKTLDKPAGIVLQRCTVRDCAQEKKLDCCIECEELATCEKDLWTRFPDFKKQVVQMQTQYRSESK